MITMTAAVNILGKALPMMFISPRKLFRDHIIRDGSEGLHSIWEQIKAANRRDICISYG